MSGFRAPLLAGPVPDRSAARVLSRQFHGVRHRRPGENASPNPTAYHPWWGFAKSLGEAIEPETGIHIRKRAFAGGVVAVNITNDQHGFTPKAAVHYVAHDGTNHPSGASITMPAKTGLLLRHI